MLLNTLLSTEELAATAHKKILECSQPCTANIQVTFKHLRLIELYTQHHYTNVTCSLRGSSQCSARIYCQQCSFRICLFVLCTYSTKLNPQQRRTFTLSSFQGRVNKQIPARVVNSKSSKLYHISTPRRIRTFSKVPSTT